MMTGSELPRDRAVPSAHGLGRQPRSEVAVRGFGSPLELTCGADGAHDHDAGRLEPVGIFTGERGPASGVLIARAVALVADQQHVPRHSRADLRWSCGRRKAG